MTKQKTELLGLVTRAKAQLGTLPASATEHWLHELDDFEQRLASEKHLVAVFGAFSAGKSSLINAMVGTPLLAVSPNPTTAAVTHIEMQSEAPTEQARVHAKTEMQMQDDVLGACERLHIRATNLEEAVRTAGQIKMTDFPVEARKTVSFLKAVAAGYDEMKGQLGQTWVAAHDELRKYTANEKYACFIQRVDVQTTHDETNSVILVDTPGVDSIHRRHTDVAFEYMRQADAVVFVLYYTHAFSRADQEFLQQLGGVQDVAGIDKCFVVINAVDLAKSEEERGDVRDRVVAELRKLGIRKPRVFEVSSQLAFAARQLSLNPDDTRFQSLIRQRLRIPADGALPDLAAVEQESGIPRLEEALFEFVQEQSETLAEEAAGRVLGRIHKQIAARANKARELRENRQEAHSVRMAAIENHLETLSEWMESTEGEFPFERALHADWDELLFHAGERIRLKYGQFVREAFHPGRFREGVSPKIAFRDAAEELVLMFQNQIEIEIRTFAMRAQQQGMQTYSRLVEQNAEHISRFDILLIDVPEPEEPGLVTRPFRAHLKIDSVLRVGKYCSTARQFFEQGGLKSMADALEPVWLDEVRLELQRIGHEVVEDGIHWLRQSIQQWARKESEQIRAELAEAPDEMMTDANWDAVAQWFGLNEVSHPVGNRA